MTRLLTDLAGPFYDPAKPFRNWSALPFYQLDLPHAPFVDRAQLEAGLARAERYLRAVAAQGYTGIVLDNLAHLVSFDGAPARIYAPDDPCRQRALIYREAFGRLFDAAAALGLELFVTTDMQWATPGLRRYAGPLRAGNARLAAANRWALDELFARFPQLRGLFVRVGEAGGAHDLGGDYTGHMLYRTPAQLRALIDTLLPVCERHGRLLVVRTWSVGIGELGDLLWSPERYAACFGGYRSPNLLVSVKHGPADFFRHLPANPTLGLPGPAQIVELQNRREYELFGMAPSGVAGLHRRALADARRGGRSAGVWAWNGTGGWGGGSAALGRGGWSLWTELSSALTAALARDDGLDAEAFVGAWCAQRLGAGPLAEAVAALYRESEALIETGWYLGPLGDGPATLGALTLPTLLWVWWMRPTAAPLLWCYLAAAAPDVAACVAAGRAAAARAGEHAGRLQSANCGVQSAGEEARHAGARGAGADEDAAFVLASGRYLRDCLALAAELRALLLPAAAAALAGDRRAWADAIAGAPRAQELLATHRAAWGGDAAFPALELDEVEAYLRRLEHAPLAAWAQARAAGLLVRALISAAPSGRELRAVGLGALGLAALGAWRRVGARPALAGLLATGLLARPVGGAALRAALPWLSRRYQLLPSIFFETGPSFREWTG